MASNRTISSPSEAVLQALGRLRTGPRNRWFVPEEKLYELLDNKTVTAVYEEILDRYDPEDQYWHQELQNLQPAIIFRNYRKIFALLILIGYQNRIARFYNVYHRFNDKQLPFSKEVLEQVDESLLETPFVDEQYRFITPIFNDGVRSETWSSHYILPYISSEPLQGGNGGFANVFRVEIHPDYDRLESTWTGSNPHEYARKELIAPDDGEGALRQEREFELEVSALNLLQGRNHPNILPLLASYKLGNRYNMIFPMADCNLKDYMEKRDPPENRLARVYFLQEIVMLAFGLANIHTTYNCGLALVGRKGNTVASRHFGSHRDLKPSNILVHGNTFIIADFGLSRFHEQEDTGMSPDVNFPHGVSTYRAPECATGKAGRPGDIWSLGCIYAEVIAFLVRGRQGSKDFCKARLTGSPFKRDWFHDGTDVKPEVLQFLDQMRKESNNDAMIEDMVETVKWMLTSSRKLRPKISAVVQKLSEIVLAEAPRNQVDVRLPDELLRSPNEVKPNGPHGLGISPGDGSFKSWLPKFFSEGLRILPRRSAATAVKAGEDDSILTGRSGTLPQLRSSDDLYVYSKLPTVVQPEGSEFDRSLRASRSNISLGKDVYTPQTSSSDVSTKSRSNSDSQKHTPPSHGEAPLRRTNRDRGYSILENHLVALDNMDTMFLIDDSVNMKSCWDKVRKSLRTFAAIATEHDKDGIEVALMYSGSSQPFAGITDEAQAIKIFEEVELAVPKWGISERLEGIISDYIKRFKKASKVKQKLKPLNIIVLTNGTVSQFDAFEDTVLSWAGELDKASAPQSQLGIQFVLIGSDIDPLNKIRFDELDENMYRRAGVRDIVDTTHYDPEKDEANAQHLLKVMCGGMNRMLDRLKLDQNVRTLVGEGAGAPMDRSISYQSSQFHPQQISPQIYQRSSLATDNHRMVQSLSEGCYHKSPMPGVQWAESVQQHGQAGPPPVQEFPQHSRSVIHTPFPMDKTGGISPMDKTGGISPMDRYGGLSPNNGRPRSQTSIPSQGHQSTGSISLEIPPPPLPRNGGFPEGSLQNTNGWASDQEPLLPPYPASYGAHPSHADMDRDRDRNERLWRMFVVGCFVLIFLCIYMRWVNIPYRFQEKFYQLGWPS